MQVAADGCWEEAVILGSDGDGASPLDALAARASHDLAVEVLWPGPPTTFVGARFWLDERDDLRAALCTLRGRRLTATQALQLLSGDALGAAIRVELGAVNAWHSVGPVVLADERGWREPAGALTHRSDLVRCRHPVALEVTHAGERETWYAVQVSGSGKAVHVVDLGRVRALIAEVRTWQESFGFK